MQFDEGAEAYRCCCQLLHVKTGSAIVAVVELVFMLLALLNSLFILSYVLSEPAYDDGFSRSLKDRLFALPSMYTLPSHPFGPLPAMSLLAHCRSILAETSKCSESLDLFATHPPTHSVLPIAYPTLTNLHNYFLY